MVEQGKWEIFVCSEEFHRLKRGAEYLKFASRSLLSQILPITKRVNTAAVDPKN